MKKLIFTLTILAAVATTMESNAQQKDSRWWVGGSVGFKSTETTGGSYSDNNSFSIAPEAGYNFSDRWGVGLRFGVATAGIRHSLGTSSTKDEFRSWSVAPFVRYTFAKWRGVTFFADGGLNYSAVDSEVWNDDGDSWYDGGYVNSKIRYGGIFVDPGVSVRLSRHLALVARMNIFTAGYTSTNNGAGKIHSWDASLNSPFDIDGFLDSFTLGFNITF